RHRIPPRETRRPEPIRTTRTGEYFGCDFVSQPDGTDNPWKVGAGAAPGFAATPSAAECSLAQRRCDRAEDDHAATHGTAQSQSDLRRLSQSDGSPWVRAGELRWSWHLARVRGTRVWTHRCVRDVARWHCVRRAGGLARCPDEKTGHVR